MCIAIIKPKGKEISDEVLKNCYERNPDGAGIAFSKNGKLYILKGIFNKDEFVEDVRKYEKEADGAMLIHCRIGTSGKKDKTNCHPHVINSHLVMIHNGVIRVDVPTGSEISDTIIFIRDYLKELPPDFIKYPNIMRLIQMAIGSYNKLAFLNEKGEYAIVNEKEGVWDDGVWYSNTTYKTPKITYTTHWNEDDYVDTFGHRYFGYRNYLSNNKKDEDVKKYNQLVIKNLLKKDEDEQPSKSKIKKLKKRIRNMSDKKMYDVGEFPLYDKINNDIVPYRPCFNTNQYVHLDEYSTELYEEWMYEYDERFGEIPNMKKAI